MVAGRSRSPLWTQCEDRGVTSSVSVISGFAGRSGRPLWAHQEGRGTTSVSVIIVVAGRSRSPFWAQQEDRSATSVSVITVVSESGGTKALLYVQNSLVLADYSVTITGLGGNSGLGEATGLNDSRGLGETTGLGGSWLENPRGWAASGWRNNGEHGIMRNQNSF
jgi:hypothetical protein